MARDDFMGADFCYGDRRIVSLGKDQVSTGNAAIWKALGFNHHITLVDRELAALLGEPAVVSEATARERSEEHTSELQSLMRLSYAVFCLKKKKSHCIPDSLLV